MKKPKPLRARHNAGLFDLDERVECLHDMSEEDAIAEGFQPMPGKGAREQFFAVWDQLHGTDPKNRAAADPVITAYTFELIAPETVGA